MSLERESQKKIGKVEKDKEITYVSYCPITGRIISRFTISDGRKPVTGACGLHGSYFNDKGKLVNRDGTRIHDYSIREE